MHSNGRQNVVDLTADSDSDSDGQKRYTVSNAPYSQPRSNVLSHITSTNWHPAPAARPYPRHVQHAHNAPYTLPTYNYQPNDAISVLPINPRYNVQPTGQGYTGGHYVPISHDGIGDSDDLGQAEKRRRISANEFSNAMRPTFMQTQLPSVHNPPGTMRPELSYNIKLYNQNDPPPQPKQFLGDTVPTKKQTPSYFSGAAKSRAYEEQENIFSDASYATEETQNLPRPTVKPASILRQHSTSTKTTKKLPRPFSEEEEHLVIFLKEVKKITWKEITSEFNKCFPGWPYHTIQSRYSTKINQRDRSQDPAQLKLPPRWAAESVIDWAAVHAENPGPRERCEQPARPPSQATLGYNVASHTPEEDRSSGNEIGTRQQRPRRAPAVNYNVRERIRQFQHGSEVDLFDEMGLEQATDNINAVRSASPEKSQRAPVNASTITDEPIDMALSGNVASLALDPKSLPYISSAQRQALQEPNQDWQWDQISSRAYQGAVLHVDFNTAEWSVVEKLTAKFMTSARGARHTTQRRRLRAILGGLTEPQVKSLGHEIRKRLPLRSRDSIQAFLQDAMVGRISNTPQVLRFTAARVAQTMSSRSKESYTSLIRQRELGTQTRRGWKNTSKPISYQVKNKVMDSLGPSYTWTGASSDIHTVAWSPEGEAFAAGAVAVTDPDSMQYNRPNNLLFGCLADNTIHELAEHTKKREKTAVGVNSTHAMFLSQDPQLYTSVTAVAFSPSGRLMYSGGYDNRLIVWDLKSASSHPELGQKFTHKAEVDMLAVNNQFEGIVATAAQRATDKSIKLLHLDEEDLSNFTKHDFCSEKALVRPDLQIFPQALKFEPQYGRLLLAGFGPSVKDKEDGSSLTTGDLCLWDVETQAQLQIHGSSRNVFDVAFNINRRSMPLFAAGCVAAGSVNRRTRSVLRLYDERYDKYTCPMEIECTALDMNDVVWCPHDEYLIAAGCTDGCVYVWDIRQPDDPLRTLPHGESVMPLEDDVPHEKTDTGIRFLSWGDNATRLYSGSSDGVVRIWDVTRSEEDTFVKDVIKVNSGIMAGSFSPDFTKLMIGEVNGSINILDVGRDDYTMAEATRLRYVPYADTALDLDDVTGSTDHLAAESGIAEGRRLLESRQLQPVPMGSLPIRQVVQGPAYQGPFDSAVDAPYLREQALQFQLSMATEPSSQCAIDTCKDSLTKITIEETGDSGRSTDRIPDELHRQWKAIGTQTGIVPGKTKCTSCSRPARPSPSDNTVLCERCAFACFRCGATNAISPSTKTIICDSCIGIWDIRSLGYECSEQPSLRGKDLDVPPLRRFGREMLEEKIEDEDTSFGDEMNALTDYYFSLAIDRPESPVL